MELFKLSNVHYESNSDYQFDELNEELFISRIFEELQMIMKDDFFNYVFFIFSNHKLNSIPDSVNVKSDKKKILFYFSDEYGKDPSPYSNHYFAIFKAYIGDRFKGGNIFPIQIGYVKDVPHFSPVKPVLKRKYNVFFRGNLNKNRIDLYRNLSSYKYLIPSERILNSEVYRKILLKLKNDFSNYFSNSIIIFNNSFKSGFTTAEYGEILAESRIVLCPKGYDMTECFRHFESMRAGCVIISEKLPKTDFYSGSPIIEVDNWKEGLIIAKQLLNDPGRLVEIQGKVMEWWEKKCSERATANYVNEKIKSLLALK
ncbi:glycosyltransferase family 47 protein [Cyclobacterium roseum]|uniref:exostosin family protein n=1 Tax=Cyclobacterium roseum TaxID=2666137 RepID=UPI0013914013|nr:exostosin family protein [Cyclobacterium roseum]